MNHREPARRSRQVLFVPNPCVLTHFHTHTGPGSWAGGACALPPTPRAAGPAHARWACLPACLPLFRTLRISTCCPPFLPTRLQQRAPPPPPHAPSRACPPCLHHGLPACLPGYLDAPATALAPLGPVDHVGRRSFPDVTLVFCAMAKCAAPCSDELACMLLSSYLPLPFSTNPVVNTDPKPPTHSSGTPTCVR